MASIFTGLAFMHGHIVDRELIFRLGREEAVADRGAGAPLVTVEDASVRSTAGRKPSGEVPARPACAPS